MWLINSSIGRKLVMSISGISLVLFLLFHGLMNLVVIFSPEAYNMICAFLGANWYALIATVGLAGLCVLHIAYAILLTVQNMIARGKERYAVTTRQKGVAWESKNMLVLGLIVVGFLGLHMYHFWYKMQWVEILHIAGVHVDADLVANATNGAQYVKDLFAQPLYAILYLVWLGALWFHLTHGVWSALHSLGLNNKTWMPRVKGIANIVSTIVVCLFAAVVIYYLGYGLGCCCAA